jgi:hypothetical protein
MESIFDMSHGRSAFFPGKETLSPGEKIWPDRFGAFQNVASRLRGA